MILKEDLRQEYLDRRMKIPAGMRGILAKKASDIFFQQVKFFDGAIIAGYWPIRAEMDDLPILRELCRLEYVCALPHLAGRGAPLEFRLWDEETLMATGKYDVPEPAVSLPVLPDFLIVPLLAFDEEGYRLGYGGGHYDRAAASLKRIKNIQMIGLAYQEQLCEKLPHEAHDVRLDMIVTEGKVYRF